MLESDYTSNYCNPIIERPMKHILKYPITVLCLFLFSIQLQACQRKENLASQDQLQATANSIICESLIADTTDTNKKVIPDYYDIDHATIQCFGFERPATYKEYVIKIINVRTKKATIQIKNKKISELQLPSAFCDTLAKYLFQFYVKKDPIILSKKFDTSRLTEKGDTLMVNSESLLPLNVQITFRNKKFKDERFITSRDKNGDIIEYSPAFLEFEDWIRYICGQYYYNYTNPQNAYW